MSHILEDLKHFLDHSPTSWHAVQEIGVRLAMLDFEPLNEKEKWELKAGGKYFVQRGGALCAFKLPSNKPTRARILGSHTDSPALKLKPNPTVQEENMLLLETEIYGAPLLSSWMNRDLALAGRVVIRTGDNQIEEKLVFFDDSPLFLPQLAIHFDRDVNEKGLVLDKQDHLRPIVTLDAEKKGFLEKLIHSQLAFEALLAFDLFLVPVEKARFLGLHGEMIASYRLDNLLSAHASVTALASSTSHPDIQFSIFWDHEEIGSRTQEGAASPFLLDTLERIYSFFGLSSEEKLCFKSESLCISLDVAHAYNPNFSKKYDPQHRPLLGKGVVIKYNADRKYASDSLTVAPIIQACQELGLPYQNYTSHSNSGCGSTIGPIVAYSAGIPTVDIGSPVFSMHSIREVAGCQDHLMLCQLLTHLLDN